MNQRNESTIVEVDGKSLRLTHLSKVMFPDDGFAPVRSAYCRFAPDKLALVSLFVGVPGTSWSISKSWRRDLVCNGGWTTATNEKGRGSGETGPCVILG